MNAYSTIERPVILFLGLNWNLQAEEIIGNYNQFTSYIFGVEPQIIHLSVADEIFESNADPLSILKVRKGLTLSKAEELSKSKDYQQQFVADHLLYKMQEAAETAVNSASVRLIAFYGFRFEKKMKKARLVLQSKFPNAVFCGINRLESGQYGACRYWEPWASVIESLGLASRVQSSLLNRGIRSIERLAALSDAELLEINGIGGRSVKEIKTKLKDRSLDQQLSRY